ncbi:MAG: hypothetical protein ACLGG0_07690 [Bacteriovoracia bacterium]
MAQAGSFLHYFVGPLNKESQAVMDELKNRGEFCVPTIIHEEIDQGQKQVGKVVVIFSDIKFLLEFIKELNTADSTLKMFLVIDQNGSFKPPVMKLLSDANITLRAPKDRNQLYTDIQNFLDGTDAPSDELVFSANTKE